MRYVKTLFPVTALAVMACGPVHFPMAVASTTTHITYAQGARVLGADDYLVDCEFTRDLRTQRCETVALPQEAGPQ
jgi:hypothetical protein